MNGQLAMTGKTPTIAECAEAIGIDPKQLQVSLTMAQDVCSLDAKASGLENHSAIMDLIPDPASLHQDDDFIVERDILHDAINMLSEEEQNIVRRYNGIGGEPKVPLRQLAEDYGISRQGISQRHNRAMNKVRQQIGRLTNERLRDGF